MATKHATTPDDQPRKDSRQPTPIRSYADLTPTVRRGDIYYFTAASLSTPGKVNTVAYCPTDNSTHCDCYAAEYGRPCWHVRHVRTAWIVRLTRKEIAALDNSDLGILEREIAGRLAAGHDAEMNAAVYAAIGDEWADRLLRFPTARPEPEPPPAAPAVRPITPLHALAPTGTEGYRPVAPPASSWPGGRNIDAAVCRTTRCDRCGQRGLTYTPFFRAAPRSYRAFAVCPGCGHTVEF